MDKITQQEPVNNSDEISLKDLILKIRRWRQFIFSKWKIILIASIVGGAIGFIYSIISKPIYKAELTFTVDDGKSGGGLSGALGLASQFGIDLGGGGASSSAFSGDNLLELMKSRAMIEKALLTPITIEGKKITLIDYYIDFNKIRKSWNDTKLQNVHFLPGADPSKFTLTQDSILGVFHKILTKNNITVEKVDKKLSIITLRVSSKNELFSKYFNEVLAKVVSDFYVQTQTEKESQNVTILQRQTDSVRRELNAALSGVASSADINPNPNPSLQILRVPSQRRQVDVQANQAMLTQLVTNLEISKLSLRKATPLIEVIDRPILPLDKDKIGKKNGILAGSIISVSLAVVLISINKILKKIMS